MSAKYLLVYLLSFILFGCAVHGPAPTDPSYSEAVRNIVSAKDARYILSAAWYPNVMLGNIESFHASSSQGKLFVTPERLVFAVYDDATNSFLKSFEASYSNISWFTAKEHGLSRILRLQTSNTVHSFLFSCGYMENGSPADKDAVVQYILEKFNRKK